jgi:hypothetical protein
MVIVNDNSTVITKLETSLTDDARVIIYDRHMFIVQATVLLRLIVILVATAKILAVKAGTSLDWPACFIGLPALFACLLYWPACFVGLPALLACLLCFVPTTKPPQGGILPNNMP